MKIRTNKGMEFEFFVEELRHFKLNNAKDVREFINEIESNSSIGFKKKRKRGEKNG